MRVFELAVVRRLLHAGLCDSSCTFSLRVIPIARQSGTIDIISNKKLDQKVVEFLHRQDYSLVENLIYRSTFLLKAYSNYPGRLRVPLQSAFTAFLRKG